jgi:hypothetical protein
LLLLLCHGTGTLLFGHIKSSTNAAGVLPQEDFDLPECCRAGHGI